MTPFLQTIINIGALATACAALVGVPVALVKLWPLIKRGVAILESAERLPEMVTQLQSLADGQTTQAATLTSQDTKLDRIVEDVNSAVKQVQNSHVTNLRDDVDEVIGKVDSLHDKFDEHLKQCPTPQTTVIVNPHTDH